MATTMEAVSKEKGRPYDPPERTKAMPKHTLFGAEVQQHSEEEKKAMKELDLEKIKESHHRERVARQQRYKPSLPKYLKKNLSDTNKDEAKAEISKQLKNTTKAQNDLELLEEKSKYFQVGVNAKPGEKSVNNSNNDTWYGTKDLENAKDINNVRLQPGKSSFNRDKYEPEKPSHQYSRIGNPIRTGQDFDDNADPATQIPPPQYKRHRAPDWLPPEAFIPQKPSNDNSDLPIDIPANIRHQFGSKVIKEVLSDKAQVQQSLEQQARIRAASHKIRPSGTSRTSDNSKQADNEYESLSHSVRQNIFPGYSPDCKESSMKHDYSKDVFNRRVPETDEHRCQRDELSTWVEQSVIRDRISKAWDQTKAEKQGAPK